MVVTSDREDADQDGYGLDEYTTGVTSNFAGCNKAPKDCVKRVGFTGEDQRIDALNQGSDR